MTLIPDKKNGHFNWQVFIVMFAITVIGIGALYASYNKGHRITVKYVPLVDTNMIIKLEATRAHLALREILSGNSSLGLEDVSRHMENVRWHINAMLKGGVSEENIILPLSEEDSIEHIVALEVQAPELINLIHERHKAYIEGHNPAPLDQKLHVAFDNFLAESDLAEQHLHKHIEDTLDDFRLFNVFMVGFIVLASFLTAVLFYRNETQRLLHLRQLLEAQEKLEQLSNTDKLTGIANRRAFDNYLESEYKRAIRDNTPLTLIMIDADCFKQFNDHYGHVEGDSCLRSIAETLQRLCHREADLVTRFGGEEFGIILPNMDEAHTMAERLRKAVENLAIKHEYTCASAKIVTISAGFCTMTPAPGTSHEELLKKADSALYQAKSLGRNKVVDCSTSAG